MGVEEAVRRTIATPGLDFSCLLLYCRLIGGYTSWPPHWFLRRPAASKYGVLCMGQKWIDWMDESASSRRGGRSGSHRMSRKLRNQLDSVLKRRYYIPAVGRGGEKYTGTCHKDSTPTP